MHEAIVIGVSAGGMEALKSILSVLPPSFSIPVAIVQHVARTSDSYLVEYLNRLSVLTVKEAESGESLTPGTVYLAPPGYHLLIESDRTFSLSVDARVNFSCPSIDVLFESAAEVFRSRLVGVVLTGANADGSQGIRKIKEYGGLAVVQNPKTAQASYMPQAALNVVKPDFILNLEQIAPFLAELTPYPEGENAWYVSA
ncbi:MAG: chemotaxis protein CheB [Alphaproteobacteria bacterium]|nr:chemotaxis protein CheB [Alphaproteobacteria bacterium]